MCGISGIVNHPGAASIIRSMTGAQHHRGPDASGCFVQDHTALGHNRLSIIDLSESGNQPLHSHDQRYVIVFNGEVYNYTELRAELKNDYPFATQTDTEVVLAAWIRWGPQCLDRFIGMFAFAVWDRQLQKLFAARDRFGVKPLHYAMAGNTLVFASEIKAIFASGLVQQVPDEPAWATYFASALYDFNEHTFWKGISRLPAGHYLTWENGRLSLTRWYDLPSKIKPDLRSAAAVREELLFLLEDAVRLRFRADVPVGVCLSGGLDSSLLLALVKRVKGSDFPIHAFTFYTGDERYDELPWVEQLVKNSSVIHHACLLDQNEIPALASFISGKMDEPYGGIPTLGMSKVFEQASELGIRVLLDGNGLDEGWAGYEYYRNPSKADLSKGPVQGSSSVITLQDCLKPEFAAKAVKPERVRFHDDDLVNLQLRDLMVSKIPRSMRFADRNSMAYSVELREPFLDHRIIELGLSQPLEHKIQDGSGKYLVRGLAREIIPGSLSEAPKRAVQTPQREWLAHELSGWVSGLLKNRLPYDWFNEDKIAPLYRSYRETLPDNSFYIWQLVNARLISHLS